MTADFESIATVTVGSGGASSVEFTSIPGTYAHLEVRYFGVGSALGTFGAKMRFNSDTTAANYGYYHILWGDGASAGGYAASSDFIPAGNLYDNNGVTSPGVGIVSILDYANTNKYKTVRTLGGVDKNGSGTVEFSSGKWASTNAITTITITPTSSIFRQYTHIALYGIRSA